MAANGTSLSLNRVTEGLAARYFRLPAWAHHTNPIVRRHLGLYWRTVPPDVNPLILGYIIQVIVLYLAIPFPVVYMFTMPLIAVAVIAVPTAMYFYARALIAVAGYAADAMASELRNDTLNLLRTTPISLTNIFLGKVASAIWRKMDDFVLLWGVAVFFSLPLLVKYYADIWPPDEYAYLTHTVVALALLVSIVRMVMEPIMVGALGIMIGSTVRYKSTATTSTMAIAFFYFMFLIMLRSISLPPDLIWLRLIFELVLPVVLPPLIIVGSLKAAAYIITRD